MTIPSEAELIEMEHRAYLWLEDSDWIVESMARDVLRLVEIVRKAVVGGGVSHRM